MPDKRKKKTGHWSEQEDEILRERHGSGIRIIDIAKQLNRKPSSVSNRVFELGLRWTFKWTPEKVETLRALVASGKTRKEIGAALGVTRASLKHKLIDCHLSPRSAPIGRTPGKKDSKPRAVSSPARIALHPDYAERIMRVSDRLQELYRIRDAHERAA